MQHSIICGVDGSQASRSAAQVAARLARTLDLRLVLARATDDRPSFPYGDARLSELQRRRAIQDAGQLVEGIVAALPRAAPETRLVSGEPVETLTAMCRDEAADLLIVGSRGRGPLAAALLGSVSARLASSAECPVVVVPSPEAAERFLEREPSGGRIVCGVDGSTESGRALHVAARLAERMGHALLPVYVDGLGTPENAPAGDDAGLQVDVGDPVDGLSRRALGDDGTLIVVGSRGRGALRAAVLGSVSGALAATAPLPVLVVPPTARLTGSADGIADRSVASLLRSARLWREDGTRNVVVDAKTLPGVVLEHEDVGRFSEGNEQLPQTPSKLRRGTFADGYEKCR